MKSVIYLTSFPLFSFIIIIIHREVKNEEKKLYHHVYYLRDLFNLFFD
jgi:hypothetical protein